MSKLYGWLAALGSSLLALLLLVAGQRDKARQAQHNADAKRASSEAARSKEQKIKQARAQVRQNVEEQKGERNARFENERPTGSLRRR